MNPCTVLAMELAGPPGIDPSVTLQYVSSPHPSPKELTVQYSNLTVPTFKPY